MATIQERFNQEGFKMLCKMEQLWMKACRPTGDNIDVMTAVICKFYGDDYQEDELIAQLGTLHQLYKSYTAESPSI